MSDINIGIPAGEKKRLLTGGKYCPDDIVVEAVGGAPVDVEKKDVNFYDYDGTLLHSYTLAEVQEMSELPPLPTQPGLICQGWNWTLDKIKAMGRAVDIGATYTTDDGKTRIYITLIDGRISPMLGCCPNGTVTVDWGDGSTPDVLTGTSTTTVRWTSNHNYDSPGDYVITLAVDGEMGFYGVNNANQYTGILRHSHITDTRNRAYYRAVKKIEVGDSVTSIGSYVFRCCRLTSIVIPNGVTSIGDYAFSDCYSLASVVIPDSVTSIGDYAFSDCYSLASVVIPDSVTSISKYAFSDCYSLASVVIPDSVTSIGDFAFSDCSSLTSVVIPDSMTSISTETFSGCTSLTSVVIPDSVTSIGNYAFESCYSLASIVIPNGVTSIGTRMLFCCYSLTSVVIPNSVTSIGSYALYLCYGVPYYDFTKHVVIPTLEDTYALSGIAADCEIRVPAALADAWKAATNWSTYADYIVGV